MTSPKLKLLQRSAGIAPTSGHASSQGMQRLERQMFRREQQQAPAPADPSDLGAAIEKLIAQRVDESMAVERAHHSAQLKQLRDQSFNRQAVNPQPARKPMPPITSTVTRRDHRGRILWLDSVAEGGSPVWRTEVLGRDELGGIRSLRTALLDGPPLPADDAVLRTPRKLFGNDQEA